jgi:N-methylhydantoinase B
MPSKFSRPVVAGDRFYHRTAGAGGWGDPLGRDPDAVAADVRDGVLTVQHAAAEYGVVIPPGGVVVDRAATESLRDSARAARTGPAPDPVPTALEDRMSGLDG